MINFYFHLLNGKITFFLTKISCSKIFYFRNIKRENILIAVMDKVNRQIDICGILQNQEWQLKLVKIFILICF